MKNKMKVKLNTQVWEHIRQKRKLPKRKMKEIM